MNELRIKDPFTLEPMEDMFRRFFRPWRAELVDRAPQIKVDIDEDDAGFTVKADIPGVRKEDIDVRVDGNVLTLSAEVKKESEEKKEGRVVRSEREYGYASRSLMLGADVDEAKAIAKYDSGVLTLKLPKKAGSSSKRLTIA